MEIIIACGIMMGDLGVGVATSIWRMDQDRASECSVAEAT